jgi:transcriptional regulator of acetoin/glycerol metabolism
LSKVEQRYDAAMAITRDGHSVTETAEKLGVSRQTVHRRMSRLAIQERRPG